MARTRPEQAYSAALHKTIPKNVVDVPVTASDGLLSLSSFSGQYIYLMAVTEDVTIRLGAAVATAGIGYVLDSGATAYAEFFVDPGDDMTLHHRSSTNATLRILYD